MNTSDYKSLRNTLKDLNTLQYRDLKNHIQQIDSKKLVSNSLETDYNQISCPHCHSDKINRWGKKNDLQRYRCKDCKRTFNSLTNTPLARLRKRGHWLEYSLCLKEGMSVRQAAKECSVHYTTTFRWRHRFLSNAKLLKPSKLAGIIELTETFFKESFKGKKIECENIKNRRKVFVVVGRDRNSNTIDGITFSFKSSELSKIFDNKISKDTLICSDSKKAYFDYTKQNNIRHGYIHLSKGEYSKKEIVHINNSISYKNNLHLWIKRFHGVATKYLINYISWFRELDEFDMNTPPVIFLSRAKSAIRKNQY